MKTLIQATARFSPAEDRLIERAVKRLRYQSRATFLRDAALHYANHRASIRRPTLGRKLKEAEASNSTFGPEGAGYEPADLGSD